MHSSRMHTAAAVTVSWGCLPGDPPGCGPGGPPGCGSGTPPARPLKLPLGCGPGNHLPVDRQTRVKT